MSWEYRVTKISGVEEYAIREVYYDNDSNINGWSEQPVFPAGDTYQEFVEAMVLYNVAPMKPVVLLDPPNADNG